MTNAAENVLANQKPLTLKQITALTAPPLLILSMYFAFQALTNRFGFPLGYLLAFSIYWLIWCVLFPAWVLGGFKNIRGLMRDTQSFRELDWKSHLCLWTPILFPFVFVFLRRISQVNIGILIVSVALGLVIGVTEEIFWRGMFVKLFPDNSWWNTFYPSLTFGLWHVCPQSVLANSLAGGTSSFIIYAVVLGFLYAFYARKAGSIRWSVVSHAIHDSLGLGGFAYLAWLK